MFLKRVQVPDFRILKDVDISFEPEFCPRIFPLGSLNGGGKSTLFQLLFVLLGCSSEPDKYVYIRNLLTGFKVDSDQLERSLAKIEILDNGISVNLEFVCINRKKRLSKLGGKGLDEVLRSKGLRSITDYLGSGNNSNNKDCLICLKFRSNEQLNQIRKYLPALATKIYLAAPFTQVFQFLAKTETRKLFKEHKQKLEYYLKLEAVKQRLTNFFTYDFLSVDYILKFLKSARDQDFKQVIDTGNYGNNYQLALGELNSLLDNKQINVDPDLSGVNFKIKDEEGERELFPEDFSHGELKRLSIYVWLKHLQMEDSIVLMDEIESTFHPDWQYQITADLAEWGASNQYILATHSYDLCQALTPAHIKELEPRPILEIAATDQPSTNQSTEETQQEN